MTVTLSIEVACDKCKRTRESVKVFLQMAPKVGQEDPFWLCVGCWLDYDGFDGPPTRRESSVIEIQNCSAIGRDSGALDSGAVSDASPAGAAAGASARRPSRRGRGQKGTSSPA